MPGFNKAAFKAALALMADSILLKAKKQTVDNSAKLEGANLAGVKSQANNEVLGGNKLAINHPGLDLSLPSNDLTILLTGTPTQVQTKLSSRGCLAIRGSCLSQADGANPTLVPLSTPTPRHTYSTLGERGRIEIEVVNAIVYRTYTAIFYDPTEDVRHVLVYKQMGWLGGQWTKWTLAAGSSAVSHALLNLNLAITQLTATPIPKKCYKLSLVGENKIEIENEALAAADSIPLHPESAEYTFIITNGSGSLEFTPKPGHDVTILVPPNKLPVLEGDSGAVTLRRIDVDVWLLTGDLKEDLKFGLPVMLLTNPAAGAVANYNIYTSSLGSHRVFIDCEDKNLGTLHIPEGELANGDFPIGGTIEFIVEGSANPVVTILNDNSTYIVKVPTGKQARVSGVGKSFKLTRKDATTWWLLGDLDNV